MRLQSIALAAAIAGGLTIGGGSLLLNSAAEAQPQGQDIGDMLVSGLKATDGCILVDTGKTQSGRNCIFAWFESKEAVMRWYYSDTHQGAMRALMGGTPGEAHVPMKSVPDDVGPVLVIASLVPSAERSVKQVNMPISAISIELYKPLPAGAFIGSSFGPPEIYGGAIHEYPMDEDGQGE